MKDLLKKKDTRFFGIIVFNFGLILAELLYLLLRFQYLNAQIPLWMGMPWGTQQLAPKAHIFIIPVVATLVVSVGLYFTFNAINKFQRYGDSAIIAAVSTTNLLLAYSVIRIIRVASKIHEPLFDPRFNQIFTPALFSFVIVYFLAPKLIEIFKERGLVTDPQTHSHPGMILKKPSARGGGMIFTIGVLLTAIFFVKPSPMIIGILVSAVFAAVLGYIDDVQNTKPISKFAWLENPVKRVFLQGLVVLPLIIGGVVMKTVNNPFSGQVFLDAWKLNLFGVEMAPIAIIITVVWVVWIINLLSWSNGVDGQYSGIIGIAGLMVAIMTLRLLHFDPAQKDMMELAAIVAGASLGLLPYSWHPSQIMWGFGAISAGIILAALSVVSQAKIATSIIVLTVPFLDGAITITRRMLSGKSPLKGDKGHLHHLLLERGWSVKKVAVFYWVTTALFGIAGIYASDRDPILTALTGIGVVAFVIITLNFNYRE